MKKVMMVMMIMMFAVTVSAKVVYDGMTTVTKRGYFVTGTKGDLLMALKLQQQGDIEALKSLIKQGRMVVSQPNVKIHVIESSQWNGWVKFRPFGMTGTLWISIKGVVAK